MAVVAPIVSTFDNKGIRQAEAGFGKLSGSASRTFGAIGGFARAAATAVAAVGVAAGAAAFKTIEAASNLEEAQAKVGQIFGDSARLIEEFAASAATSLGQSKQSVLDAAGVFGTFGKAAGLSGDDLALFSNSFTKLATDMASFNNTSPEEAVQALGAALRGEAEPLRRYGILLDDATLKQAAMELGIYDGNGALTQQQKILAAQKVIWEQAGDQIDDFKRTQKGLANQTRILRAQLANIAAAIGAKLLPVVVKAATFVNEKLIPAFGSLYRTFQQEGISGVFDRIGDALNKYGPIITAKLKQLTGVLWEWIQAAIPPALEALGRLLGRIGNWLVDTGIPKIVQAAEDLGDALVEWIKDSWPEAKKKLDQFLSQFLRWIFFKLIPKINNAGGDILAAFVEWTVDLVPELVKNLKNSDASLARQIPGLFKKSEGSARISGENIGKALQTGAAFQLGQLRNVIIQAAVNIGSSIASSFKSAASRAYSAGVSLGSSVINGLRNALGAVAGIGSDLASSIANGVVSAFKGLWNRLIANPVNAAIRKAVDVLDTLLGPINFPPAPNVIPTLARGGIVDSPTLAIIGDRRLSGGKNTEAVVPLNKLDNMGGGITINVSGALDPVAVAKQIRQILLNNQVRLGYSTAV